MEFVLQIFILFFSIIAHEYAHGRVALMRGDPTAYRQGRLTFNPLPHIDPFGTIILPILQWLMLGRILFGYAKPVPVNPYMLKNPRRDMTWVSAAGPAINFLIGCIAGMAIRLHYQHGLDLNPALQNLLWYFFIINIWLAIVNLVPVPPLDGSRILIGLLPKKITLNLFQYERLGMFLLVILIVSGFFENILSPIAELIIKTIVGLR